jgi:23S rRNA (guanosine2251-2'-O)-methyltransferase
MHTGRSEEVTSVLYGIHAVEELLANRSRPIERVYFEQGKTTGRLFAVLKECRKLNLQCQVTAVQKLNTLARSDRHQGVVVLCGVKDYSPVAELLHSVEKAATVPFLLLIDSVENPGNLGAVVRTALAAGVQGIMLPDQGCVGLTATVAKAASGALERMPVARVHNIAEVMRSLADRGYDLVALEQDAPVRYNDTSYTKPLVAVIGGEDKGIRPHIKRCCTAAVAIPMSPASQSLNLSVATGIFLYEVLKQRSAL